MHRIHTLHLLLIAFLAGAGAGCTKQAVGLPGATGPAGQAGANGSAVKPSPITGYIDLFDQYANPYPSSAGATLSLRTTDTLVTATTDSTGNFSLGPVGPGNYEIKVTKPGFDSLEFYVQHSGGNEPKFVGAINMLQTLTWKITGQTVAFQSDGFGNSELVLTSTFTGPPMTAEGQRGFFFYFSHSSNVSSQNNAYALGSSYISGTNQMQFQFLLNNLTMYSRPNFSSGDSVYVKTIATHPTSALSYFYDYSTNLSYSYPYVGDSTVTSFILP